MLFTSFLKAVGHNFKVGLEHVLPWLSTVGVATINTFIPALGPVFNSTVIAITQAEQSLAALGKQDGTGPQKLAMVLQIMEPLIAQALKDAGKDASTAAVTQYINSIVNILNLAPAPKPVSLLSSPSV